MSKTIKIKCKGAGVISLNQLNPIQGKFKILTEENAKRLRREILDDGFIEPISIWEDPASGKIYVLNGHQRLAVLNGLRDEGYTIPQLPISYVEADNIEDAKRKVLALASQYGSVSTTGLRTLLDELNIPPVDVSKYFNFPEVDLASMMSGLSAPILIGQDFEVNPLLTDRDIANLKASPQEIENEDEVPEPPKVAKTKRGDIYQLGNHRLMCGDSTDLKNIELLLNGEKIDMVFTDPPYGIGLDYNSHDDSEKHWFVLIDKIMPIVKKYPFAILPCCRIKALDWWYLNHKPDWIMCWYKGSPGHRSHIGFNDWEPHLVWGKPKNQMHDFWQTKCGFEVEGHPCPKPVEYAEWVLSRAIDEADNILDLFGGSGTTMIACEKLNRNCYMIEIDPIYCDVIVDRWESFTNKKAHLLT